MKPEVVGEEGEAGFNILERSTTCVYPYRFTNANKYGIVGLKPIAYDGAILKILQKMI